MSLSYASDIYPHLSMCLVRSKTIYYVFYFKCVALAHSCNFRSGLLWREIEYIDVSMATSRECESSVGYHNRVITLEPISVGVTERTKQNGKPRKDNIVKEKEEFLSQRKERHNLCQLRGTVRAVGDKRNSLSWGMPGNLENESLE